MTHLHHGSRIMPDFCHVFSGGGLHAHAHARLLHLRRYVAGVRQYQRAPVSPRPPTSPPHHRTPFIPFCSPRRHHRHLASCMLTANLLLFHLLPPRFVSECFQYGFVSSSFDHECVTVQKMVPTDTRMSCCQVEGSAVGDDSYQLC